MNLKFVPIAVFGYLLISVCVANAQRDRVSSKLDLDETKEESTSESRHQTSSGKSSPKIQGVRVTVDTGDVKKSKESDNKESVEVVDAKNKKRVGIHTDITFEITDDKSASNTTSSENDNENDASVPVFKGHDRNRTTPKPRKPYDPKNHPPWVPSASQPDQGHHNYIPRVIPVYPQSNNDQGIYRSIDNWSNFAPITGVWTTERSYHRQQPLRPYNLLAFKNQQHHMAPVYTAFKNDYSPQQVPAVHHDYSPPVETTRWRPCLCDQDGHIWGGNSIQRRSFRATSPVIQIDDKLASPFSATTR